MNSTDNINERPKVPAGVINLYKEQGFTSFDAIAVARGILRERRIGHMGTLDPMAEGVLPLMIGTATTLAEVFAGHRKCYLAEMTFGSETDTQDSTGEITAKSEYVFDRQVFEEAVRSFIGPYSQIPPMYSAKKVAGKKLVDLARKGREVERKACDITIYNIDILSVDGEKATLRVECSSGTYIRTLCEDIGRKCTYLAHMSALKREQLGKWTCEKSYTLGEIEAMYKAGDFSFIEPLEEVVGEYPSITVPECDDRYLLNGNKLTYAFDALVGPANEIVRMLDSKGAFRALYRVDKDAPEDGELHLRAFKMFL